MYRCTCWLITTTTRLQRYVEGETYVEIADALNRHTKSIDNALQRIKKKLDTYLAQRQVAEAEVAEAGVAKTV